MKRTVIIFAVALVIGLAFYAIEGKAQMGPGYGMGPGIMGGGGYGGWHMGPGMMGWGYGMGWLGMILMAAFWIAIIVGIVFLIRWVVVSTGASGRRRMSEDSPLEILKTRYARGEIDREEFHEKKKDLGY